MSQPRRVLTVLALATAARSPAASAAGFECARAATPVERAICRDPALNRMDEQMALAYGAAAARCPADELKGKQQRWLREVRDACGDAACLASAYQKRLAALQIWRCEGDACPGHGPRLIGAWRLVSDSGSFEEIAFRPGQTPNQGRFDTWLHHRPEFIDGRWQLQGCELRLTPSGEPDSRAIKLTVQSVTTGHLKLREQDEAGPSVYRRIER